MALPVLVINRAQDIDRLTAFQKSANAFCVEVTRIDALDAHRPDFPFALYADLLRDRFWESDQIKPGAFGCFLSHRRAWQYVVDHDMPMALICEDDAELLSQPDPLEQLVSVIPDFDLIFANGRMTGWCATDGQNDRKPLGQVISDLARLGGPKAVDLKPTPGGDCYLVSAKGAAALLKRTEAQGIVCGVDWAMVWNGLAELGSDVIAAFPELEVLQRFPQPDTPLKAYALARPVADQRKGPSVLKHSVSYPIADLRQRGSEIAHAEAISTITVGRTSLCFACRAGPDPVMEAHRSGDIWDEPGLSALLRRFPSGGTFVDIGAHSGNHSVIMARLGGAERILAIEANAEIHRLLRTNMAINGVSDCLSLHPSGVALASKPGRGWLIRNRRRSSETMVKAERPERDDDSVVPIELITGDAMMGDSGVDAIKVDTAGSEVDVVKGLIQTLKRQQPLLLLDHATQSLDRIHRLADEVGYRIVSTDASSRKNRSSSLLIPHPDGAQ